MLLIHSVCCFICSVRYLFYANMIQFTNYLWSMLSVYKMCVLACFLFLCMTKKLRDLITRGFCQPSTICHHTNTIEQHNIKTISINTQTNLLYMIRFDLFDDSIYCLHNFSIQKPWKCVSSGSKIPALWTSLLTLKTLVRPMHLVAGNSYYKGYLLWSLVRATWASSSTIARSLRQLQTAFLPKKIFSYTCHE